MIKHLTRKELDVQKYDNCISKAVNTRIYACSWYLDIVCDDWDVLINDDYKMVMPLPKRNKYGVNYIYQVPWIQQLGVFSDKTVDEPVIHQFIKSIPKKFKLIDTFLNSNNKFSSKYLKVMNNYILPLNLSFDNIKDQFNKNRKRVSKINFNNFRLDRKGDVSEFLSLYKKQSIHFKTHKDSFEKLARLLNVKNGHINIWNVYNDDNLVAGLCWLKGSNRITYLLPISTDEAKKENIPTFILNQLIKEYENTNYILDFEGSIIEGVAQFYKSFGAVNEEYYWFKKKNFI